MLLTNVAIKRPLIVLIALGALLAFGVLAITRMGVQLLPTMDVPIVTVTTVYPGVGPNAVDSLVTRKIEDAVAGLSEVDHVESTSTEGLSSVSITFTEKAPKDSTQQVERRVSAARADLPVDAKAPSVVKMGSGPEFILGLQLSGTRNLDQLQRLADDTVKKQIEAIPGVARVDVSAAMVREIQVRVDQQKLQARGLSILQVTQALSTDNLSVPSGGVSERDKDWTIRLNSQAQSLADLQAIVVASGPGGVVRVADVGTVIDTHKPIGQIERTSGNPSLSIGISKQASANTVTVSEAVKKAIPLLESNLPAGVTITVQGDAAPYITNSVADVQHELLLAVLLTGLVLLVFLHTFRSTLIVLLAIPTSLMSILGISFNFMSLMGLALTVGILVDDSIVVLENIARHLKLGETPEQAAINGRSEIGMAAIAITLVDVVVFTPVAFMSGFMGAIFRDFGLVIASATLFSLLVSFTLTPLLASRWLAPRSEAERGYRNGQGGAANHTAGSRHPLAGFARIWDAGYARLERGYAWVLRRTLRMRWVVIAMALVSFVGGLSLVTLGILPSEGMPRDDAGMLTISVDMPSGTPLAMTDEAIRPIEAQLLAVPEVENVFTSVTAGHALLRTQLNDRNHRTRTSEQVAAEVRGFGAGSPGVVLKARAESSLGGSDGASVQVQITGEDQQVLASLARQVSDIVRQVPGTADVNDGGVVGQPELVVNIDRQRAADVGLTPAQVASVLRTGLAGSTTGTFRPDGTKGWDITVILNPEDRARVAQVTDIPMITPAGASVRLGQVAQVAMVSGPTQVNRRDRMRSVTVSADLAERASGAVTADVQAGLDKLQVPAGYTVTQGGAGKEMAEQFLQIFMALGTSVVLMYLLMALLFESLFFPLIVILSLPLAVVGAFGLLTLTGNTLNLMSMIGMILLTGLVGKNAILLVDYTNHLRRAGLSRGEALLKAGPTRLRPILMTTAALILAMLPLAAKLGDGGEWRAPLAVTVIGGLLTSTILTLVVVPAVYTLVDDLQRIVISLPARARVLIGRTATSAVPSPRRRRPLTVATAED